MIFLILLCLLLSLSQAIDPWNAKPKIGGKTDCKEKCNYEDDLVVNVLYKKLILLILSNSEHDKDTNGGLDGSNICFFIPGDKSDAIKKYASLKGPLAPSEILSVHEILVRSMVPCKTFHFSDIMIFLTDNVYSVFKHYWFHIMAVIIVILFCIAKFMPSSTYIKCLIGVGVLLKLLINLWELKHKTEVGDLDELIPKLKKFIVDLISSLSGMR